MDTSKRSDLREFHDWLYCNKTHLQNLTLTEIADRAILVGHPASIVRQWETHERFQRMRRAS